MKEKVERLLSLPASLESAELLIDEANEVLTQLGCPEDDRRNLDVVIDEICCNIAQYAYPEDGGTMEVKISSGEGWTEIRFFDTGLPFNPLSLAEPELTDVPEIGGLGISLVRKLMDSVEYCRSNGQNRLYLFKKWQCK